MSELRWPEDYFWGLKDSEYWIWLDHTELTARRATPDEVAGWPEDEYYDEVDEGDGLFDEAYLNFVCDFGLRLDLARLHGNVTGSR
jgi:hypothetical protein